MTVVPFNPLDKANLGSSVGQAMLRQKPKSMALLERFMGAGIYAIYYSGNFRGYEAVSEPNTGGEFRIPIYIGKAVPAGARRGGGLNSEPGNVLYSRLKQHVQSIEQAKNLEIVDFHCRYLIVDDIWIPLGESLLIAKFNPLWNAIIDGFGNHNPGRGRHAGLRPRWDVVHPGRPWAENCQPRAETAEQILGEARDYLRNNPPPEDSSMLDDS